MQELFGEGKRLRYLCQDEMRLGLKTQTGRVITGFGVKPRVKVEWKRDNFWVYGVVEPVSGWHFEQEYAALNSEQFQEFLDAVSAALGEDMALMQLDQAQAHQAGSLRWPENVIPILQPAHAPELNPVERFWQHLKAEFEDEHFATLGQVRQRLQQVLDALQAEEVASLTSYDFILEALFYAAS